MNTKQISTNQLTKFVNNIIYKSYTNLYSRKTPTGIPKIAFYNLGRALYNNSKII